MSAVLEAKTRKSLKRSETRELRLNGDVPAVLYGKKIESKSIAVPSIEFLKTIREVGRNGIIELDVEGENKKHKVIVHDLQVDPLKDFLVHIDFFEVDLKSEMDADVTVNLTGEAPGEKEGGVLSPLLYSVTVRALPANIPEEITVDVSDLNIGDAIQVSDLTSGKDFEITNEPDETVVTVLPPDQDPVEEESDEGEEPELVDGDKDSSEGAQDQEGQEDNQKEEE